MKLKMNWKMCGGAAVFEANDGRRVHLLGMCLMPDGRHITDAGAVTQHAQARFIRIQGGNRRRGMMAWAESL